MLKNSLLCLSIAVSLSVQAQPSHSDTLLWLQSKLLDSQQWTSRPDKRYLEGINADQCHLQLSIEDRAQHYQFDGSPIITLRFEIPLTSIIEIDVSPTQITLNAAPQSLRQYHSIEGHTLQQSVAIPFDSALEKDMPQRVKAALRHLIALADNCTAGTNETF